MASALAAPALPLGRTSLLDKGLVWVDGFSLGELIVRAGMMAGGRWCKVT